tara:strand:+ start:1757 stop:1948 length:192 start_codon:yes stop_codon:yes gene_type:complete
MLAGICVSAFITNLCGWVAGDEKVAKGGVKPLPQQLSVNNDVRAMFDLLRLVNYRFSISGYIA